MVLSLLLTCETGSRVKHDVPNNPDPRNLVMHRSGKGKNVASALKYHGTMWYNFAVPHFAVPNSHLPNPPWLHNPCRLGDPHRFRAGGRIRKGPQVGKVAT